jgi:hypothetical protein
MPYFHIFLWDGENDDHVNAHGISAEEFEYVVLNTRKSDLSRSSGRPIVIGETASGRRICCVYEIFDEIYCYPITAFDVE